MKNDDKTVENLISGGIIGAALGALISDNKEEGATIGAIAGAVIFATLKANEAAKQTHVPFYVQENNILYQIQPDGSKLFVKNIEKPKIQLQQHFTLK